MTLSNTVYTEKILTAIEKTQWTAMLERSFESPPLLRLLHHRVTPSYAETSAFGRSLDSSPRRRRHRRRHRAAKETLVPQMPGDAADDDGGCYDALNVKLHSAVDLRDDSWWTTASAIAIRLSASNAMLTMSMWTIHQHLDGYTNSSHHQHWTLRRRLSCLVNSSFQSAPKRSRKWFSVSWIQFSDVAMSIHPLASVEG